MAEKTRSYQSYLLRLWQTEEGGYLVWRARLEHVQTHDRTTFATIAELIAFLEAVTGQHESEPDADL